MKIEKENRHKTKKKWIKRWRTIGKCKILTILQESNTTKTYKLEREQNNEPEENKTDTTLSLQDNNLQWIRTITISSKLDQKQSNRQGKLLIRRSKTTLIFIAIPPIKRKILNQLSKKSLMLFVIQIIKSRQVENEEVSMIFVKHPKNKHRKKK